MLLNVFFFIYKYCVVYDPQNLTNLTHTNTTTSTNHINVGFSTRSRQRDPIASGYLVGNEKLKIDLFTILGRWLNASWSSLPALSKSTS